MFPLMYKWETYRLKFYVVIVLSSYSWDGNDEMLLLRKLSNFLKKLLSSIAAEFFKLWSSWQGYRFEFSQQTFHVQHWPKGNHLGISPINSFWVALKISSFGRCNNCSIGMDKVENNPIANDGFSKKNLSFKWVKISQILVFKTATNWLLKEFPPESSTILWVELGCNREL